MRTKYFVFASVLAGIPVTFLPARAEPAAADTCLIAPDQKAPEGSQWRYRLDRTTNRKCYFLRSDADKVRSLATKPDLQRSPVASPAAQTGRPAPVYGQPTTSSRGAAPVRERAQDTVISGRWPDPVGAVGTVLVNPASGADAGSTTDTQGGPSDQSSADSAPATEAASALDYRLMLAFLVGALVVAGVIGRLTFRRAAGMIGRVTSRRSSMVRQRRKRSRARKDITRMLSQSQEMMSSLFARAAAAMPRHFHHATMGQAAVEEAASVNETVALVPQQHHVDDHPQPLPQTAEEAEEIDVLLRQLERFGERPAA